MRERIVQGKKAASSVSIPTLKQPTRGFGLDSLNATPAAVTQAQPINKPITHDISRISLRPQAKLTIGQPGDSYEQEADSVAQQVMQRMAQPGNRQSIQRQEAPEEEEELQMKPLDISTLQRQEMPEEEEELQMSPMVQRQGQGGMAATPDLETSINQARGGGQPLGDNIRKPMEQAFGADFGGVKVHTDSRSDQLNQSIQARAFTTGQDVFFRQGEYNPGSRGGQELLAHELTHVVQQNGGTVQRKVNQTSSQVRSSQFIQTFSANPAQKNLIRDHKTNIKIQEKGWDDTKIDELVEWCKSENQYNSFINNLSYKNWQILKLDFTGDELPNKVLNAWVTYQRSDKNKEIKKLDKFTGYKGSQGTEWNTGRETSDWSACYIATNQEQAEGYIAEAGNQTGIASMWELQLTKELPVLYIKGGFIEQDDIPGEFKALVLKKVLKINIDKKLVPYLGSQEGLAYIGPGGEAGEEMAMPWGLLNNYFTKTRIKEYTVENYEIKSVKTL